MTELAEALLQATRATARRARVARRLRVADARLNAARAALQGLMPGFLHAIEDRRGRAWSLIAVALDVAALGDAPASPEHWRFMNREVVREAGIVALDALRGEDHRAIVILSADMRRDRIGEPEPARPLREVTPLGDTEAVIAQAQAEAALAAAVRAAQSARADLGLCKFSGASRAVLAEREREVERAQSLAGRAAHDLHGVLPGLAIPCVDLRDLVWGIAERGPRRVVVVQTGAKRILVRDLSFRGPYTVPRRLSDGVCDVVEASTGDGPARVLSTCLVTALRRDDEAARRLFDAEGPPPSPKPPRRKRRAPGGAIPITRKRGSP